MWVQWDTCHPLYESLSYRLGIEFQVPTSFSTNLLSIFLWGGNHLFFFLKMKALDKTSIKALFREGGHTTVNLIMSPEKNLMGGTGLLAMPFKCHFIKLSFVIIVLFLASSIKKKKNGIKSNCKPSRKLIC